MTHDEADDYFEYIKEEQTYWKEKYAKAKAILLSEIQA